MYRDGMDMKKLAVNCSDLSEGDSFLSEEDDSAENELDHADFVPPHMLRNDPQTTQGVTVGEISHTPKTRTLQPKDSAAQVSNGGQNSAVADLKAWQKSLNKVEGIVKPGSVSSRLPSDDNLLASMIDKPKKSLPGSRCPFPHA